MTEQQHHCDNADTARIEHMLALDAHKEFQRDAGEGGSKPDPRGGGAQEDCDAERGDQGRFGVEAVEQGAARAQARRFSREQSKASSCRDERSAQRPAAAAAAKPAPAAAKGMPPPSRGVVALASRWRTGRGAARRAAVDRQCRRASRVSRDSPRALPRRCRCAKDAAAIARRRARGGAVPRGCGTNGVSVGIRAAAVPHAVGNVCVLLVRGSTPYHSDSSSPRHDTCAREYALFFYVCAIGCRAGVRLVSRAVRWSQRRVAVRTARARFCASPRVDAKRDGL